MRIVEKHQVESIGSYRVMEGVVDTGEQGEVSFCWIEDVQGNIKSEFTNIDQATGIAGMLAEEDAAADSGAADAGSSDGDGDGGNGGGD